MTPQEWHAYAARTLERETGDPILAAYERGEFPTQPPCSCCVNYVDSACAAVVRTLQTGPCSAVVGAVYTRNCSCYGSVADGGLCEDCYVSSK